MMKKLCERTIVVALALVGSAAMLLSGCSCRGPKRDAAYYEQMVDSIRRAEQVKMLHKQMGITYESPADAFFDTLRVHTLPLQSAADSPLGDECFSPVPNVINDYFGYPPSASLRALQLPHIHHWQVVLLAETGSDEARTLYICVMDKRHRAVDMMCVEEGRQSRDPADRSGLLTSEFYITSNYDITIVQSYREEDASEALTFQNRRFIIKQDGHFEETIIEY